MWNRSLLKAAATVAAFWSVLLVLVFSDKKPHEWPVAIGGPLALAALTGLVGVLGYSLAVLMQKSLRRHLLLKGDELHGARVTLGRFPRGRTPLPQVPLKGRGRNNPFVGDPKLSAWFEAYRKSNPAYAALMIALANAYNANPRLPASPVIGGHGGLNLRDHTDNVLRQMLAMIPTYSYEGYRLRVKDKPVKINLDYEFEKDRSSPILPLLAFAHDLGKLTCYKIVDASGKVPVVEEVKPNHDEEGARLIVTFAEFWGIPVADRETIVLSMAYYHHHRSMPLWCDDRTRAFTELLINADQAAGRAEGVAPGEMDYEEVDEASEPDESGNGLDESMLVKATQPMGKGIEKLAEALDLEVFEEGDAGAWAGMVGTAKAAKQSSPATGKKSDGKKEMSAAGAKAASSKVTGGAGTGAPKRMVPAPEAPEYMEWVGEVLGSLGTLAKKHNDDFVVWDGVNLFFVDSAFRKLIGKVEGVDLSSNRHSGQQHPFTKAVMTVLAEKGLLLQDFDGHHYSASRAMFDISYEVKEYVRERKFVFISKPSGLFDGLAANLPIVDVNVVANSFGEHASTTLLSSLAESTPEAPKVATETLANKPKGEPHSSGQNPVSVPSSVPEEGDYLADALALVPLPPQPQAETIESDVEEVGVLLGESEVVSSTPSVKLMPEVGTANVDQDQASLVNDIWIEVLITAKNKDKTKGYMGVAQGGEEGARVAVIRVSTYFSNHEEKLNCLNEMGKLKKIMMDGADCIAIRQELLQGLEDAECSTG